MKRTTSRRDVNRRQSIHKESEQAVHNNSAEETIVNNPVSAEKLAHIQQKQEEVNHTEKIKESSAQLVQYFRELSSGIKVVTESAQRIGDTLENWEKVFTTMGEMNRGDAKESQVWVRLKTNPEPTI